MTQYIPKSAVLAEIEKLKDYADEHWDNEEVKGVNKFLDRLEPIINALEVKEVDIEKLCGFRENIGFAYPEGASEYQKQLACYRQGIKDVIKAQKGE